MEHFGIFQTVLEELSLIVKHELYSRDLIIRDPVLHTKPKLRREYKLPLGVWQVKSLEDDLPATGYECLLLLPESGTEIGFAYDPSRISGESAQDLLRYFSNFIHEIEAHPDQSLESIRFLDATEEKQQLAKCQGSKIAYPTDKPIHRLFEEQASLFPDRAAVCLGDKTLTYQQLNIRANALAHRLIEAGVVPDTLVGLGVGHSIEMIVGLLAILKAGAGYLPLDPLYPEHRLKLMAGEADLAFIVTNPIHFEKIPKGRAEFILIDPADNKEGSSGAGNPGVEMSSSSLAYAIFTSGSTGKPKGVLVEHRSLVNYAFSAIRYYGISEEDRILQLASLNFDASAEEIFCALIAGATLVIRCAEILRTQEYFMEYCRDHEITVLPLPTALWHELVGAMESARLKFPPSIRLVVIGGEKARTDRFRAWKKRMGSRPRLINSYGPTEATVVATWYDLGDLDLEQEIHSELPIGTPVDNVQAYVLDSELTLLPPGVSGELYIAGAGLARGYLNSPDLTAGKFVSNPFEGDCGSRMYRTGDKVCMDRRGNLIYLGRIDQQLKIRGFRIEPGEIESVISRHPGVREVTVEAKSNSRGEQQLVAYVVPVNPQSAPSQKTIRNFLKQTLPDYMVPGIFMFLKKFPLTPANKIDRTALPEPEFKRSQFDQTLVAPRTTQEEALLSIWSQVLEVDEIGVNDDFFELGGHSLLASQVIARIRQEMRMDVPLRTFFDSPNIAKLIKNLQPLSTKAEAASSSTVASLANEEQFPLSFAQQRLWFLDRMKGSSAEYNVPKAVLLRGQVNLKALEKAIQAIVARHQSFRTRFLEVEGKTVQSVVPSFTVEVPCVDLSHLPPEARDERIGELLKEEAAESFDIASLPLMKCKVFVLGPEEHIVLLNVHHIVFDGWSMGIVHHELGELYNAFLAGSKDILEPISFHYTDYTVNQRSQLQGAILEEQLAFWRNYLKDAPTLNLPTDYPRPVHQTFCGARHSFTLSPDLVRDLLAFNRTERVTPFMSLLAVFQVLLSRYSGQDDFLVGTPIANRLDVNLEKLIGFFVNTMVMRSDLSGDPGFRELVKRVRDSSLDAFQYQDLPFEKLVEELNPKRDLSRHPLFQVMFAFQNAPGSPMTLDGLEVSDYPFNTSTTHFDMEVHFIQRDGIWTGGISYNTDLFEAETIQRFSSHYVSLLKSMLAQPEASVSEVAMLTEADNKLILADWNNTVVDYPSEAFAHSLFEIQAATAPAREAVRFLDQSLTYEELNTRSNQLARHLLDDGAGPDMPIAIYLNRSVEMLVAVLAVHKAGGACMPLDPEYPQERLLMILEDAKPRIILTEKNLSDPLLHRANVVILVDEPEKYREKDGVNFPHVNSPEGLAYILYTSGSTGRPKGVEVPHRTLHNLVNWQLKDSESGPGDRTLQFASLNFDVSFQEIYATLASGGTLVVATEVARRDLNALAGLLESESINRIFLPYIVLSTLAEILTYKKGISLKITEVITAGEQLKITPEIRSLFNLLNNAILVNQYGPTETHVVTSYSLTGDVSRWPILPPVGKPISNTRIYILDRNQQPVPIGVSGEIYVGGKNVARGYLNMPSLTDERFLPSPWVDGDILYRTGDIGYFRRNGLIEFSGRCDDQMKIRGFRVEPGEIEACLTSHPEVRESVVLAWDVSPTDKRLAGYIVSTDLHSKPSISELRDFLRKKLPDYMVPVTFVFLDQFPLSPNRKVDRKALPVPEADRPQLEKPMVAPRNATEETLLEIWSEVLGIKQIGVEDDFFELGGHSLLATQVVSRISHSLQVNFTLRMLFESPTIAEQARMIPGFSEEKETTSPPSELIEEPEQSFPLSFAQEQMWFIDRLEGSSPEYLLGETIRVKGSLDYSALENSLNRIIARHESLRASFIEVEGEPRQLIAPEVKLVIKQEDISRLNEQEKEEAVTKRIRKEYQTPFDLTQCPLLRVRLLRLDKNEHVLVILFHHIVYDGWSARVFHTEFSSLYQSFAQGKHPSIPPLSVRFSDYVLQQQAELKGRQLEKLESYWLKKLSGAPPLLTIPTDGPRKAESDRTGGQELKLLTKELSLALNQLFRSRGVTLFMGLLAAFRLLLSRLSGQEDVVLGCPMAGRNNKAVEELIGLFLGTLALRTDLSEDPTFNEFLKREMNTILDAFEHQDLPFEKVVRKLKPERSLTHTPVFQVMVNLMNFEVVPLEIPGLEMESVKGGGIFAKYDLTLYISEVKGCIQFRAVYKKSLFRPETISQMLEQLAFLLEQVVENSGKPVSGYSLVTPSARPILPDPLQPIEAPPQVPVSLQFLEVARKHPEQTAVASAERSWTYQELKDLSLRIASLITSRGVQPGEVVLISGPRGYGLISSILAVLHSRGVVLLVDPSLPRGRRDIMLREAKGTHWIRIGEDPVNCDGWSSSFETLPTTRISDNGDCLDAPEIDSLASPDLPIPIEGDSAYIFFTSGSTGIPKAVLGSNKGLSHFINWERELLIPGTKDRVAQLTGLSFDVILRDIFLPLTSGAALCLPPAAMTASTGEITQWLKLECISIVHTVPSLIHAWLDRMPSEIPLPGLRYLLIAGEPLSDQLIHQWRKKTGVSTQIINLYGTTETTLAKSFYKVPPHPEPGVQSIGLPMPNTQFLILGPGNRLCGIGEPGEIIIRTPFRTQGYLNNSSPGGFAPNPFRNDPEDIIYRTGDQGAWSSSGRLTIFGRTDDQVKIRGIRMEPGEIAAVISCHEGIQRCVVIPRSDKQGEKRLVAYVVPKEGSGNLDLDAVRQLAGRQLPEYMVPAAFVILETLPLTPTGKIDRKSLPEPEYGRAQITETYVAARTEQEKIISGIWLEVLKLDKVGVYDNFFHLGGHSLMATQVTARIRQKMGLELPLTVLFAHPTIAGLAEACKEISDERIDSEPVTESNEATLTAPLSFAQQRLWFLDQLEGSSVEYNMPRSLRLKGRLDVEALEKAINSIVQRHASLRTRFIENRGEPVQLIEPSIHIQVPLVDLSNLDAGDMDKAIKGHTVRESSTPFDLRQGPMIRATLLRIAEQEHLLLWTCHHIVFDAWSFGIFYKELAEFYKAHLEGRIISLDPLSSQYPEYALHQRQALQGEKLENELTYWRNQLAGAPDLDLPLDYTRPATQSYRGGRHVFSIPQTLTEKLTEFNKAENVTPFMSLLSVFNVLLARYTGRQDLLVGTPVANRHLMTHEEMIGFFVNNLVIRTDLSDLPGFRGLVTRVRKTCLNAFQHQDLPFEKLVEALNPKRDLSRHPVCQVFFTLHNAPSHSPALEGLQVTALNSLSTTTHFDLSLNLWADGDTWKGTFSYSTDLFEKETIEGMQAHFLQLLKGMLDDPKLPYVQVPMLTGAENQKILNDFNAKQEDYPLGKCVHELFEEWAEKTPDAIAAVFEGESLSYRELNVRANQLAHHLQSLGVGPESLVGICLERSNEMLVSLLAIFKAGGAYVPLDPHFPVKRLSMILEDASIQVLLTQSSLLTMCDTFKGPGVLLDEWEWRGNEKNPESQVSAENPAYVIFTSGSTGRPKGVVIEHRAAVNFLNTMKHRPGIRQDDVVLAVTTISFDISVLELFLPITTGASVVIMPDSIRGDGFQLTRLLRNCGATILNGTPATWKLLLLAGWRGDKNLKAFTGGEALSKELAKELLPQCRELWNLYGPTETTVYSLISRIEDADTISIGTPAGNTQVYIVDAYNQPMPAGLPGELLIGGLGLAREYLNQPDKTEEQFIPDPFSGLPGSRLYRTGDLCRLGRDGKIDYIGRMDNQVKIRGFRIELGEIEVCATEHAQVRECVTIVWNDKHDDKKLVSYVIPSDKDNPPESPALLGFMRKRLPDYMVPSMVVVMDTFPLTPNGKTNRKALPVPEFDNLKRSQGLVPPGTRMERLLTEIWSDVLEVKTIGVDDDFFEAGGHSLLAIQVLARIKEKLGFEIQLRTFFESPTIAALAGTLPQDSKEVTETGKTGLEFSGEEHAIPLSFSQQGLWFLDRLEGSSVEYNLPRTFGFKGELNIEALQKALEQIVLRHGSLRTHFSDYRGEPRQVIETAIPVEIPVVDLSELHGMDPEAVLMEKVPEEKLKPFDLSKGPLFRVVLFRKHAEDHVLMFTCHHSISDGWSLGIFSKELSLYYNHFRDGVEIEIDPLPLQYSEYAIQQRKRLTGEVLEEHLEYWKTHLADPPLLVLPTDHPRPPRQTYRGNRLEFSLSSALSRQLNEFNRAERCTPFMSCMAAFQALLSRYSGQDDILVGTPIANRQQLELEGLIGYFVNMLVFRTNFSGQPGFRKLVKHLRDAALDGYQYQELPFDKVVESINPKRDLSRHPIYQVSFTLQNTPPGEVSLNGLELYKINTPSSTTHFDLSLHLWSEAENWKGTFSYSSDLFEPETIVRLQTHFVTLLERMLEEPEIPVSQIPLLTLEEKRRFLGDWNVKYEDCPQDKCIHELFEDQVEKTPDKVALVFEDESLTYRELNERANWLANYLRGYGVGPEVLAGICITRSCEMMIGILAVLKAGGTYVPLDAYHPESRLRTILEDAGIQLLLTQRSLESKFSNFRGVRIWVDELKGQGTSEGPGSLATPKNSAYVIYTSGSTGRPNGVIVEHASAVNMLNTAKYQPGIHEDDVMLAVATISFDISIFELLAPLTVGARLVIMPDSMRADGVLVSKLIRESRVTIMHGTPSMWKLLLLAGWEGNKNLTVLSGGERLTSDLAAKLLPLCRELWNLYGPTEATVYSLACRIYDPDIVSIGSPVGNTGIYIVDRHNQLMPIGLPGELLISGRGVARGYVNNPGLTNEKFIRDPFLTDPEKRVYCTGDLCQWRPDGTVEYLGRMDKQVKIHGFRIEPGEIEVCLASHPGVRECVVSTKDDPDGGQSLVAYLISALSGNTPENSELKKFLRERLPDYMVPANIVWVDAFPLTLNGKVDFKALPDPEREKKSIKLAPRTEMERTLAGIWTEVLGIEEIGIHDNFFDLGGHSLLATQVVSRIRTSFAVEFPLRQLFDSPTIAQLTDFLEADRNPSGAIQSVDPRQTIESKSAELESHQVVADDPREFPISYAQYRLWFLEQLEGNLVAYKMPSAIRLEGKLNVEVLRRTFEALVVRHEPYRTVFKVRDGEPYQLITNPAHFDLPVIDLSDLDLLEQEREANRLIGIEAKKAFDLEHDLMLRATLLHLGEDSRILLLTQHHIATDGWSNNILWHELSLLYKAFLAGESSPLPPLPMRYAEHSLQQKKRLIGAYRDKLIAFWRSQLEGVSPLELPTDRPRPLKLGNRGGARSIELPEELVLRLRKLSQGQNMTVSMALMATFQLLLSRLSGQTDFALGIPSAGRATEEEEKLIGFFVNTIVLRGDLSGNPTFVQVLKRVKDTSLSALDHQEMPFELLVEELQPERDLSRNPLFQVLVNMQEKSSGSLIDLPGIKWSYVQKDEVYSKFDLTLYIIVRENTIHLRVTYSRDLFNEDRIAVMLNEFAVLLQQVTVNPNLPVSEYSLVTDDLKANLKSLQSPIIKTPQDAVMKRFFDCALRNPSRPAISQEGATMSYQDLARRLWQLASVLQKAGLKPGDRVAIEGTRSFGCIVSLLGSLTIGGVIVPIDPELPENRKISMLEQAGARLLISCGVSGKTHWWQNGDKETKLITVAPGTGRVEGRSRGDGLECNIYIPSADSPAYIFFTSGTTGKPKGILGRHEGLSHFINWQGESFGISVEDRVSQLTSLSFDVCLRDIFLPLTHGAQLCLPPEDLVTLSPDTLKWLKDERITVLHTVPSILDSWLHALPEPDALPDLRWTFSAGEPLQDKLVSKWRGLASESEIVNLYGPTETSLAKCWYKVPAIPLNGIQPIGESLPGCVVMVMNSELLPAGIGETGEIVIRTPYASLGYLETREDERNGFIMNPHRNDPDDRLYRSGDLGRFRPDGVLEILGRTDDQIKIRGIRIEPRAVETVLERHPAVETCRVLGLKDGKGENYLAAYLVAPSKPSQDQLYKHLQASLPPGMIPSAFVFMDALPLTLNGKLDRKALPEPGNIRPKLEVEYVAPRDEHEQKLVSIFMDLLAVKRVGVNDNFFHLGGNSLRAVQLCYKVNNQFRKSLRVASVFESPTVAQLAKLLKREGVDHNYTMLLGGSGGGDPIFFMPGVTRNALVFRELVKRLNPECPCYGIELPSAEGSQEPLNSVEELAAHCINEIRKIQSEGPYRLVGFSFGGVVAFETARQLQEENKQKSKVILFDSYIPKRRRFSLMDRLLWFGRMLVKGKLQYVLFIIREIWYWIFERFGYDIREQGRLVNEILLGEAGRLHTKKLHERYTPKPTHVKLMIFNARITEFSITYGHLLKLWKQLCGGDIQYERVEVNYHNQVLREEHLDFSCLKIRSFLSEKEKNQIQEFSADSGAGENPATTRKTPSSQQETGDRKYCTLLSGSGKAKPLFFLPGITRNAFVFREMVQQHNFNRPCYGIELPPPEADKEPLDSIQAMAGHCVREIRRIQSEGPYCLAGYSFGGLLAFETARQLYDVNSPVSRVFLFNPGHLAREKYSLFKRLGWFASMLKQEKHSYLFYYLREFLFRAGRLTGLKIGVSRYRPIEVVSGDVRPITSQLNLDYQPVPLPLKLMVFTTRDIEYSIASGNEILRWDDYCTGKTVFCRVNADRKPQILKRKHLTGICNRMQELLDEYVF